MRRLLGLVGIAVILSGCTGGVLVAEDVDAPGVQALYASELPVVAILDSALNFYHEEFRSDVVWDDITGGGTEMMLFEPSDLPGLADAERADIERLRAIPKGSLIAFNGTRVLAYQTIGDGSMVLNHSSDHGTGTAYAVTRAAPHALVVVVQVHPSLCLDGEDCFISPTVADAMEWVADQAWIDVVSISLNPTGNAPDDPRLHAEMRRFLDASKKAHDEGKIIVNSAGNQPATTMPDYFAGPPWIVAVGGYLAPRQGEAVLSSRLIDVIANYSQDSAIGESRDGYDWNSGTSISAPVVAGVIAQAMWIQRSASSGVPEPPRQAWRDALNASALHAAATDWSPTTPLSNNTFDNLLTPSLPIVYAPLQMGWGVVEASLPAEIARRVMEGDFSIPPEKTDAIELQARRQALREEYWALKG